MKPLMLCLLLLCALATQGQERGLPILRNYAPKEYGGSPQVFSVAQDSRGVMYFAGQDFIEYDGVRWKVDPYIARTLIPHHNRHYLSNTGDFGYLEADHKGVWHRQNLALPNYKVGDVWSVTLSPNDAYFQASDYIFRYQLGSGQLQVVEADSNGVFSKGFMHKESYYTRLSEQGLVRLTQKGWEATAIGDFFRNKNDFNASMPYSDTLMMVACKTEGLWLVNPLGNTLPKPFGHTFADFLADNQLYSSAKIGHHYMLGSTGKGALLFDSQGKTIGRYSSQQGLQNNAVYAISQDASRNIWLGLSSGIGKTEHGQDLTYWDKTVGLEDIVECVVRHEGQIYVGTHKGFYKIDASSLEVSTILNSSKGKNWSCLSGQFNSKNILLLGAGDGIYNMANGKASKIYDLIYPMNITRSESNHKRIYFVHDVSFESLYISETNQITFEGAWQGIKDDIRGIIEDEHGDIWLGTFRNGVIRVTPDTANITQPKAIRYYKEAEGFASLKNILPFRVKGKIVWGSEKGLYQYNPATDRFEPFCELGEQFCNGSRDVFDLQETPDGRIWICPLENKKADIGYLQPNGKGGYDWIYKPFRRIPEMFLVAFHIEPNGVAWIGGSEGLYRYDGRFDTKDYEQPFNCLIREVVAGKDSLLFGGAGFPESEGQIAYAQNALKILYAAPFFDQEERTLYSYRLLGSKDTAWSDWGRQAEKEYTNLFEGSYVFEARAKNVYDNISSVGRYHFRVLPPWYREWWAFLAYLLLGAVAARIGMRLYTRKLKADKARLEGIVLHRTTEIVQQKEELQAQAERLHEAYTRLKEMDDFKEGLAGMIVHDLKNPLSALMGLADEHADLPPMQQVKRASQQMLRMVMDILDVQKLERPQLSISRKPTDMQALVSEAIGLVQYLADEKHIVLKNEVPQGTTAVCDASLLLRVLENLLTNAIKYSSALGTVAIGAASHEKGLQISVADSGQGIPANQLESIFGKFTQVEAKNSGRVRSTGLGLAFCKLAIEAHGGKIWATSEPSKGTIFYFVLEGQLGDGSGVETAPSASVPYSENEVHAIAQIRTVLAGLQIYQGPAILEALQPFRKQEPSGVQTWISLLETAILDYNEPLFNELIYGKQEI